MFPPILRYFTLRWGNSIKLAAKDAQTRRKNARLIVRHAMRGRLRATCELARTSEASARCLRQWLSRYRVLKRVHIGAVSGDVILVYDPGETDPDEVLGLVRRAIHAHLDILESDRKLRIRDSRPGRLRVRSPFLRASEARCRAFQEAIGPHPVLQRADARVEVSCDTGEISLTYDAGQASVSALLTPVQETLDAMHFRVSCSQAFPFAGGHTHRSSFARELTELGVLSGFAGYSFIGETFFKGALTGAAYGIIAAVSITGSIPLYAKALKDLREGRGFGIYSFLSIASIVAIVAGSAPAAMEVIWVLRLGMLLERYAGERSRRAIRDAFQVAEQEAHVLVDGVEVDRAVGELQVGDRLVVFPGEKIPADGQVLTGVALVDESPITGRALPDRRQERHKVFAGTTVAQGTLTIVAEAVGSQTYVARTLCLVEAALADRAPVQREADRLAILMTRFAAVATLGTFVLTADPVRTVAVLLVMACPCATVLAASTALSAALANAARQGILIKGSLFIEKTKQADCYCFDKTGTITETIPDVVAVIRRWPARTEADILSLAASAEGRERHPLARALVKAASRSECAIRHPSELVVVPGRGVRALVDGEPVLVGNAALLEEHEVATSWPGVDPNRYKRDGHTVVHVAASDEPIGLILVGNTPRREARPVLDWLRSDGVSELHLLTGDTQQGVGRAAAALGFDSFRAELRPEDKAAFVAELERAGKRTVMVGDGVNDTPAFSRSFVGIAMGAGGIEAAIAAADVALVDNDLQRLVTQRQLASKCFNIIRQNFYLAVGTDTLGVMLAAGGVLTPVMAGSIHVIHTLGIMLNSSRLLGWRAPGVSEPILHREAGYEPKEA